MHIAKQEYHKYDILTYILQPGLSKIVQYVLFQKFILLQIAFHQQPTLMFVPFDTLIPITDSMMAYCSQLHTSF